MRREKVVPVAFGLVLGLVLAGAARGDIETGLVGYWPLDGDGTDLSGNELHGTVNGNVMPAPDRSGYADSAMSFPGDAASNIAVADAPALNITGEMTLAAWVFLNGGHDNNSRILAKGGGSGARSWNLNIEAKVDGVTFPATMQISATGATSFSVHDTEPLPTGRWVHMAGVYRPGEAMELYVDGALRARNTTDIPAAQFSDNGLNMLIGSRNACGNCGWNGFIDEARVYGRALSPEDIEELVAFHPAPRVKAWNPEPADGATGIVMPLFRWKPGVTAALHDIYVGTNPEPGAGELAGFHLPITTHWYGPGLVPGVTYYWRVDEIEVDMTTVHTGDVWQFTAAPVIAYDPRPYNGARWVDPDVDLSWTGGLNAIAHEVYFGTDEAAVAEGTGETFKVKQPAITFDPGTLQAGTTYYWRVDEVSTAGTEKGQVWSFTTIGPGGGAKGEYFTNMDLLGDPAVTRIDPVIDFSWPDGSTAGTNSPAEGIPTNGFSCRWTADLEVDRADTYTLVARSDDGVRVYLDGVRVINNWTDHGATDDPSEALELAPGRVYSLVMEMYENTGAATARLSWESPSMARQVLTRGPLQPPRHAGMPSPAHGTAYVPQGVVLSWRTGDEATQHDVHFGDDAEAVANADTSSAVYQGRQSLDATTFDAGTLEWGKTYHWRIDEVNGEPLKGSVWSFTTADCLVVDNFESYNDDIEAGTTIFDTWIDGLVNNTGSLVGYWNAPFAEQTIVHGGNQSMPLDYNNVNPPYYSEVERTWDTPQNWTIDGVDTLTLYVRGRASNGPDRLYIAVQDSTNHIGVAAYPDSAIFTATTWTEWRIPLAEFNGVNAAKVRTIYIGVGDRDNPKPGGGGLLYIDDIRVTRPAPIR